MKRPSRKSVLTFLAFSVVAMLPCAFSGVYGTPGPSIPRASDDALTPESEQKIRALIEKLASKNSRPTKKSPFVIPPTDWDDRHQEIVYDAEKDLSDFGKAAFPILLEHLDDDRYSLTASYAAEVNHSVGDVCRMIVQGNVDLIGMRYKNRDGVDGKSHMCPIYFSGPYHDLKHWWEQNRNKTLKQMRVDATKWRIKEEERIGFSKGDDGRFVKDVKQMLADIEADRPQVRKRRWSALFEKSQSEKQRESGSEE